MSEVIPRNKFLTLPRELQYAVLSKFDIYELRDLQANLNSEEELYAIISELIPRAMAYEIVRDLTDRSYNGDLVFTTLADLMSTDLYLDDTLFEHYKLNDPNNEYLYSIGDQLIDQAAVGFEYDGRNYIMYFQLIDPNDLQPFDSARYDLSFEELVDILIQLIQRRLPIYGDGVTITEYN